MPERRGAPLAVSPEVSEVPEPRPADAGSRHRAAAAGARRGSGPAAEPAGAGSRARDGRERPPPERLAVQAWPARPASSRPAQQEQPRQGPQPLASQAELLDAESPASPVQRVARVFLPVRQAGGPPRAARPQAAGEWQERPAGARQVPQAQERFSGVREWLAQKQGEAEPAAQGCPHEQEERGSLEREPQAAFRVQEWCPASAPVAEAERPPHASPAAQPEPPASPEPAAEAERAFPALSLPRQRTRPRTAAQGPLPARRGSGRGSGQPALRRWNLNASSSP